MSVYTYQKQINSSQLEREIRASVITVALERIDTLDLEVSIYFKADLSTEEIATLSALVDAHVPISEPIKIQEVVTQAEKNDKVLKLACAQTTTFTGGVAVVSIKIPGTPGGTAGRFVAGGYAFSDVWTKGDRVTKVQVVDHDDIKGYGAGTVLKPYHDSELPEENQGWLMYPAQQNSGEIEIDPIGGYGFIPAGFYLDIYCECAAATWFAADYWWGKGD